MPSIVLTPRDDDLITTLARVVVLEGETIRRRWWPKDRSGKSHLQRLNKLRTIGLVDAHDLPIRKTHGGRAPKFYSLSRLGAERVVELTGTPPLHRLSKDASTQLIFHRLNVARFMLNVTDAARSFPLSDPEWILEQQTTPGVGRSAKVSQRFRVYEDFETNAGKTVACRPDVSGLVLVPGTNDASIHPLVLYGEIDNSTDSREQIENKLPGYFQLIRQGGYGRHWSNLNGQQAHVRVLFVCKTMERVRNLIEFWVDHPGSIFTGSTKGQLSTAEREVAASFWRRSVYATTHKLIEQSDTLTGGCWYRPGDDVAGDGRYLITPRK